MNPANSDNVYEVKYIQYLQGDQLRGMGGIESPNDGRRVIAQFMHDEAATQYNPPTTGSQGSANIASDGSVAALVPANRAMTWQLTDEDNKGIVRERVWLSFIPGEVRVCTSCHGENTTNQAGLPAPTNAPLALTQLLNHVKTIDSDNDGTIDLYDAYPNDNTQHIAKPLDENFQAGIANWIATNGGSDAVQWQSQSGDVCNGKVAVINNRLTNNTGTTDQLTRTIDLTNLSVALLNFDVAYARYNNTLFDGLRVKVVNCSTGETFTIYQKTGSEFATAPDQTTPFTPANCTQWRTECLDLSAFAGQVVELVFENVGGWGNKLYIDNIRIWELDNLTPTISGNNTVCANGTQVLQHQFQLSDGEHLRLDGGGWFDCSGQGTAQVQVLWSNGVAGSLSVVQDSP